jgi:polyisoprenyl-phosphate glycosyltransferase
MRSVELRAEVSVDIVVPLLNEAHNIEGLIENVTKVLEGRVDGMRFVLVDDGSTDSTWPAIQRLARSSGNVTGIRFTRNFGKEAAILAGLREATHPLTVVMDGDLQHPPAVLAEMLDAWQRDRSHVVSCVKRERPAESSPRRWSSRLFYRIFMTTAGMDLRGATDFKLLDQRAVQAYLSLPEAARFFRALTHWLGLRESYVYYDSELSKSSRESRWSFSQLTRYGWKAVVGFSSAPLRIVTWLGLLLLAFSVALAADTLYNKLTHRAVEGFTTVILTLLVVGSCLMIGLGIVGEYIAAIYDEIKRRPAFVVEERCSPSANHSDTTRSA